MHLETVLQVATMLLAAGSSSDPAMRSSHLAKEFPKQYDDRNAVVEQITVEFPNFDAVAGAGVVIEKAPVTIVTITDGAAFCRLFDLTFDQPRSPRTAWCKYSGSDFQYHYLQGNKWPEEIYRVRRALVPDEKLSGIVLAQGPEADNGLVWIPFSCAADFYLERANLDRSLVPIISSGDLWFDLGMPVLEVAK
jgi:hypothetical protein